jgi:hypothetical protein
MKHKHNIKLLIILLISLREKKLHHIYTDEKLLNYTKNYWLDNLAARDKTDLTMSSLVRKNSDDRREAVFSTNCTQLYTTRQNCTQLYTNKNCVIDFIFNISIVFVLLILTATYMYIPLVTYYRKHRYH